MLFTENGKQRHIISVRRSDRTSDRNKQPRMSSNTKFLVQAVNCETTFGRVLLMTNYALAPKMQGFLHSDLRRADAERKHDLGGETLYLQSRLFLFFEEIFCDEENVLKIGKFAVLIFLRFSLFDRR